MPGVGSNWEENNTMASNETIIIFKNVSFEWESSKPILNEATFAVRRGSKITLMGQNGAGKSTIFNLSVPHDRVIKSLSGGQQARLLLASALIQNPDVLLLDEPTNNLDKAGIAHLTEFLIGYDKTCLVISHDADFLNAFTQGVLYLDVHTHKVEQYRGDYHSVVRDISARIEKENRKNAQLGKQIQENKDKANVFAHKGGGMRALAKRMREKAAAMEEAKVDVRKEDKTTYIWWDQTVSARADCSPRSRIGPPQA